MNAERGIPIMRPMFMEHPEDPAAWTIDSQYMLGADLLVAPVMEEGSVSRSVRVPAGEWKDFWTGKLLPSAHKASDILVEGCLGMPPVLVRASSPFSGLFEQAAGKA
jgi:alpha-glucosidase